MTSAPVCFVNLDSLNVTPYFEQYRRCLSTKYDIIYWDRGGHDVSVDALNVYRFFHKVDKPGFQGLIQLAIGYLGFRLYATRILNRNNYKRVVALTGNTATLLSKSLRNKYSHRYIIDIRDYFLEDFAPYRMVEERTIEQSGLAFISSPAYTAFLGKHKFLIMHNVQTINDKEAALVQNKKRPSNPLIIASIGTAKNLELDKKVISFFANDPRFLLRFIGRGYERLAEHCSRQGITNVELIGDFESSETLKYYADIDVILSMYGNEKTHFKYQLTNKLYYAMQLNLPIIVSPGTYMASVVSKYHLGFALDLNERESDQKQQILSLFTENAANERSLGISQFAGVILNDNTEALQRITDFLQC